MTSTDFDAHLLSEEDRAVVDSAARFADEVMRPIATELDELSPEEVIADDSRLWEVFRGYHAAGFHAMGLPEEIGGITVGPIARAMVAEEMGRGASDLAISMGASGIPFMLAMLAPDPEIQKLTAEYAADTEGKLIGCWAITEPDHGSDLLFYNSEDAAKPSMAGSVRAELKGDEYVINSQKAAWVSNGTIATHAALWVCLDPSKGAQGSGIAIVPLDLPGVTRGKPLNKLGQRALNQGEVFFNDVRIPRGFMVADTPEAGIMITNMQLAGANAGMAMCFTGVARAAYEEAYKYAEERVQGGKPIIEHQNIQLKLFEMFTQLNACRAISRKVASYMGYIMENMAPPPVHFPISAKIFCTRACFQMASEAIQIHGGVGLTKEYPIEKIFRDARASMIEDGVNETLALAGMGHLRSE